MSGPSMTVTVTYNNEKHSIQVVAQQENSEPTLQDLALLIEQVTGVPLAFQKLIYKGKSLKEMEQPLSALGVKNGCRVMLIGKKNSPEEEAELKKLRDLEKSVEKIADQLVGVNEELGGIQKGFLAKDLRAEALSKLDKRIKGTVEQFMKILEQIDSLTYNNYQAPLAEQDFQSSTLSCPTLFRCCLCPKVTESVSPGYPTTLPENFRDCRLKRKGLVKKVQAFLAQCDTVERRIEQETDKLQSKNLALAE
ncbi:BAG family molecular chaperone regulator 1 isoform X1 [Monodelphis domestica]|uniref:BAG family molecular chaperone regulator 1 isoform X1 n=2 Tax=Monodelphis domestica TaxID=13616 RepID=UPI0024E1E5AD|nr:BAG family molecular chaperone regulator 1 isoform X1 [Monodelphis domestica]